MRKAFGVIVIIAAVGAVTVLVKPSKPSIGEHLKRYRATERRIAGNESFMDAVSRTWRIARGNESPNEFIELEAQRAALVKLGYLELRTFVTSNRPVRLVASNLSFIAYSKRGTNGLDTFASISTQRGTNLIEIVCLKQNMPQWEEWIRKADVPTQISND